MSVIKWFTIVGFVVLSMKAEAQPYKLLNLTELQVRQKLRNKYPVILHEKYQHESASGLIFKNNSGELQLRCIFFFGINKCSEVQSFEKAKNWKRIKKSFGKKFNIISEYRWRSKDNTFEIFMLEPKGEILFITYRKGISNY